MKRNRCAVFCLLGFLAVATSCSILSKPASHIELSTLFSDNMVLQQEMNIPIWGKADPGGRVTVEIANQQKTTRVSSDSTWRLELNSLAVGGPYTLTVFGEDTVALTNVMVGEVWICSGQSNMEMPLAGWGRVDNFEKEISEADYPNIRLFQVDHAMSVSPKSHVPSKGWQVCNPTTIPEFSSTAYFFGRHVHKNLNIPIGLIQTAWGGTVAEAWTSGPALKQMPAFVEPVEEMEKGTAGDDELAENYEETSAAWYQALDDKDAAVQSGGKGWQALDLDTSQWNTMVLPTYWENAGLKKYDGIVWFRKEVSIPQAWAGKNVTLHLGPVDNIDVTWFNGEKVGGMAEASTPRVYNISSVLVKAGKNILAVKVTDLQGTGGIWGKPKELYLKNKSGQSISLAGDWKYRKSVDLKELGARPVNPVDPNRPTVLYNAMLAPLMPYAIRGAIWYQGESNAGRAFQYQALFPTMINDWRANWGQGEFPFLFVQLANFKEVQPLPKDDEWAELREAQLKTLALPNTGMAVTIDIGDAKDIHPKNKQEVGRRLALNALGKFYGKEIIYSGPIYKSMAVNGKEITLSFEHVNGGLKAHGSDELKGFSIAGADKKFYWADAKIVGETVVVSSAKVTDPVAVRYAWAINPVCNLCNKADLPASPFRTDQWKGITEETALFLAAPTGYAPSRTDQRKGITEDVE
jgi:sialate O-acetylesterase